MVKIGGGVITTAQVLLIQEDEAASMMIARALEEAGFALATSSNAPDGLKRLRESSPDLVIMARDLPVVNGEDPFIWFRRASDALIVVIGGPEGEVEMLESGADSYMITPVSLVELVAKVRSMRRRHSLISNVHGDSLSLSEQSPKWTGSVSQ